MKAWSTTARTARGYVVFTFPYSPSRSDSTLQIAAASTGSPALKKTLLDQITTELVDNLGNDNLDLNLLQRAMTELLISQIGDVKDHATVAHLDSCLENIKIAFLLPMAKGDSEVLTFIQAQALNEKFRLEHVVKQRKASILSNVGVKVSIETRGEGSRPVSKDVVEEKEECGKKGKDGFWRRLSGKFKKVLGEKPEISEILEK